MLIRKQFSLFVEQLKNVYGLNSDGAKSLFV